MKVENPAVNILLSTFQPEEFLEMQLKSISKQEINYLLYIRDDSSSEEPKFKYIENHIANIEIAKKNIGPKNSFFKLLQREANSPYVAFCDQDDIWLKNKLQRAIEIIGNTETPILYYSNAYLYENNEITGQTNYRNPGLVQSFFENNAMGCTIVLNRAAANLIKTFQGEYSVMHDWTSLLIVKLRGQVVFDSTPTILYRLHRNQTIGYRRGRRMTKVFDLKHTLSCVLQMKEIINSYPPSINNSKDDSLFKVLNRINTNPRLFFIRMFFLNQMIRRSWHHEIVLRVKFLCLAITFKNSTV